MFVHDYVDNTFIFFLHPAEDDYPLLWNSVLHRGMCDYSLHEARSDNLVHLPGKDNDVTKLLVAFVMFRDDTRCEVLGYMATAFCSASIGQCHAHMVLYTLITIRIV